MRIVLITILLFLFGCSIDMEMIVDKKAKPFLNSFLREAAVRGVEINTDNLIVKFIDFSEQTNVATGTVGLTSRRGSLRIVQMDTTIAWYYINPEYYWFHEFGHALLDRRHNQERLLGGEVKSIMSNVGIAEYHKYPNQRKYYIDELFDPGVEIPDWSQKIE